MSLDKQYKLKYKILSYNKTIDLKKKKTMGNVHKNVKISDGTRKERSKEKGSRHLGISYFNNTPQKYENVI